MSKNIEWGIVHGEGEVVAECDNCFAEEDFPFEDSCYDFKEVSRQLRTIHGWISKKIHGEWYDFCCEECYKEFLKNNTH